MQLQAFRQDHRAKPDVHQHPKYILQVDEIKLQSEQKQPVKLPASVKVLIEVLKMIEKVFSNLPSNFGDENWHSQQAITATRNERFIRLNGRIGSSILGTLREYLSGDSVDDGKSMKLTTL